MSEESHQKKISWSSDKGLLRYGTLNRVKIGIFQSPISQQPFVRTSWNFFGDSPLTNLNILFMVHIREPHQIWEKGLGWNHEYWKLAPSLALISEMVEISDLDHEGTLNHWDIIDLPYKFGRLPIKWSRDIKAWKS